MTRAELQAPEPLAIDRQLARMLSAFARGDAALLHGSVLLLGAVRGEGGSCAVLSEWSGRKVEPDGAPFPDERAWRRELLQSGLCRAAEGPALPLTPLVLDRDDRLYLQRQYAAEQRIAAAVRSRLHDVPPLDEALLKDTLLELFPRAKQETDWQCLAALAAVRSRLCVITGGPGTGKTWTVGRLLALLLRLEPTAKVALAAPTGKAGARLDEALREQLPALLPAALQERIEPARTLHRLLGYLPAHDAFRFHVARPLPHDVVIVDEVSMMDLTMADALFAALRPQARLVLLGDRDQLASVASGQVLGDLCRAANPERGPGPGLARAAAAMTGRTLTHQQGALADHVVLLRENHRFAGQPGLGACARALMARDHVAALAALRGGTGDLQWLQAASPADALASAEAPLRQVFAADSPERAIEALNRFRVLCAVRHGPFGVENVNRLLEQRLVTTGLRRRSWYWGRPVLVTQNDHFLRLWNGDLGVCWPDEADRPMVWFRTRDGLRGVPPVRLPPHETAFAMTVHKAQGSEFDAVLLLLPDQDGPLCNASLVYTGLTRAKSRAVLCGTEAIVTAALGRWPDRTSGLGAALR